MASLGLKAMVHCYAARARGYKIKSIGTLLDEPPTGLISLKSTNIKQLSDIKNKRIGYVGEFGKIMVDNLAIEAGIKTTDYIAVRVGMDGADHILKNKVDAIIGIGCFQQLELEDKGFETQMLRLDELANLGCCCFCSILFIANEEIINKEASLISSFMQASLKGARVTREDPELAFDCFVRFSLRQNTDLNRKIFYHVLPFISRDLNNVERDWKKVSGYAKKINIINQDYDYTQCFTNNLLN